MVTNCAFHEMHFNTSTKLFLRRITLFVTYMYMCKENKFVYYFIISPIFKRHDKLTDGLACQ